jgi:hypothetical protein
MPAHVPPLTRRPDWEDRLAAYLARCRDRPHRWGSHDCMLFAAGVCRALTGFDPARGHRGKYCGAVSAARYLRSLGWASPEAAADTLFERIPPAMARRGDLVLHVVDGDRGGHPGVCIGAVALFVGEAAGRSGLVRVPMRDCAAAWRIG